MGKMIVKVGLLLFVLSIGFVKNVYADCTGAVHGSDECRVTANRTIWAAGNAADGYPYRDLYEATPTTRLNIDINPNDWYDIGVTFNDIGVSCSPYCSETASPINADSVTALFCMDPAANGGQDLYAQRFLGTIDSEFYKTMDYGFLYVLTGGGKGPLMRSSLGPSTAGDSWARLNAVRMVSYMFNAGDKNVSGSFAMTLMNKWLNEDSTLYDALNAHFNNNLTPKSYYNRYANGILLSGAPVDLIKSYFYGAMSAMLDYAQNMTSDAKVDTNAKTPQPGEVVKVETADGVLVSKDVVHTIIVSGLANNGDNEFIINDIMLEEEVDGLEYYISSIQIGDNIIEGEAVQGILGQNLIAEGSGYDLAEDTTILITVHFEGYESSNNKAIEVLKCGQVPIKYFINGSYQAGAQGLFGEYTGVIWYNDRTADKQRYIGVEVGGGGEDGDDWSSPYETYLIDECSCDDLIDACIASGNINSEECQELFKADCGECVELEVECELGNQEACEEYGAVCDVECFTTVSNFDCCDASNQLVISTADNHEVDILGPDDVRACFVSQIDAQVDRNGSSGAIGIEGAKDDVENSYSLYDIKDQNKYCHVSCKEDYMMTMPTAKLVNAGRYFTFKASVEGEKICYTNTINKGDTDTEGSYVYDIANAQVAMINAYNEFRKWEELAKSPIEEIEGTYATNPSCSSNGCSVYTSSGDYKPTMEVEGTVSDWQTVTNINKSTGEVTTSSGARNVADSSVHQQLVGQNTYHCSGTYEDIEGNIQPCSSRATYYTGWKEVKSIAEYKAEIEGKRESARSALKAAKEAYEAVIEMFHNCTNDSWSSEMNYDPDVYYDYEESYLNDLSYNRGYMDESLLSSSVDAKWFCIGDIGDKEYTVCNGRQLSSREATFVQRSYWVCEDEKRCHTEDRSYYYNISDADYLKKTSNTEASYVPSTLFYNLYPSGNIGKYHENEGDTLPANAVALDNKLPVSLSTERGIYKYTVNMGGLGEYYEYDQARNLGRLIDGSETSEFNGDKIHNDHSPVINKQDYTDYVNELNYVEYACSYLVNMGITDADTIICDFDTLCTGDDCIADCIGPNCDSVCHGEGCIADCIGAGCIYDVDAGSSMIERVVSLNNLFPNGTDSYNWNREKNEKAATTIDEIQEAGNSVYDGDPILSVTITPNASSAIKKYNDNAESNGGYSNNTLNCYNMGSYEKIACYSTFINDILNGIYGEVVNDRSLILGNNYRTVGDNDTQYFTLWNGKISETDMLGPSWK